MRQRASNTPQTKSSRATHRGAAVLIAGALALTTLIAPPAAVADLGGSDLDNLLVALDREYQGFALCDQAVRDFGPRPPFTRARARHQRQIGALAAAYRSHGLEVPQNPYLERMPRLESLEAACYFALRDSMERAETFERLAASTGNEELKPVYQATATEARERGIPAFRDCAMKQLATATR